MMLRISIRYKILAVVVGVVVAAMASYLFLALSLFTEDKLAYVYDLNSTLVKTLGQETSVALHNLSDRLRYFASEKQRTACQQKPQRARHQPGTAEIAGDSDHGPARSFFQNETDVLVVELWTREPGGAYSRTYRWLDAERLAMVNLLPADLTQVIDAEHLPWDSVGASDLFLQNNSLAPDIAVLSLAVATSEGAQIAVAHMRPDRLLRIFGESDIYSAFLVDRHGVVLVHPDPVKVINRANLSSLTIVRDALEGRPRRGVRSYVDADGRRQIGAFSSLEAGGVSVLTAIPERAALAAADQLVRKSILFAIGIICIAVLISVIVSRRLTTPLRHLEEATRAVARGERENSVVVRTGDEVGRLALAFNKMVSDLHQRERELESSHQQLLQSSRLAAVGEMAAGISHEVKNPLGGMRGFAQLGLEAATLDEAREFLTMIEKETTRAHQILENLLKFARKQKVEMSPLGVNAVVDEAVSLVKHQLQTQRVQLHVNQATDTPTILGNSNQLQQVLLNLMLNAQHAMEETGGGSLHVATCQSDRGEACISIRDTGSGMDSGTKAKLFRPFFTTKAEGTGLGLSVTKRIVTEHRGRIEVISEVGEGTTFYIYLPPWMTESPRAELTVKEV